MVDDLVEYILCANCINKNTIHFAVTEHVDAERRP